MSQQFHLDILPQPQRELWGELSQIPPEFSLYGGTAIALRLGHRESMDYDFFGTRGFNALKLVDSIPFLKRAKIIQSEPNTLSVLVERGTGVVKVSFFGVPHLPILMEPDVAGDNGLRIASILDLAGTKVSVVQVRAEVKDYLDIDAMLASRRVDLPTALVAGQALYGSGFTAQSTLKALCYFADGNVHLLAEEVRQRLTRAAAEVDLQNLPALPKSVKTSSTV